MSLISSLKIGVNNGHQSSIATLPVRKCSNVYYIFTAPGSGVLLFLASHRKRSVFKRSTTVKFVMLFNYYNSKDTLTRNNLLWSKHFTYYSNLRY